MASDIILESEFVSRKNLPAHATPEGDDLTGWMQAYFSLAVTTAESSRKVQHWDLNTFLAFMDREVGHTQRAALTPSEERQLLDAADLLLEVGGRSRDRRAHSAGPRPRRKGYRLYRNRAIVYTLIGTGMRRAAIAHLNVVDVDVERRLVTVTEKGGVRQSYHIRREALTAIREYLEHERP